MFVPTVLLILLVYARRATTAHPVEKRAMHLVIRARATVSPRLLSSPTGRDFVAFDAI